VATLADSFGESFGTGGDRVRDIVVPARGYDCPFPDAAGRARDPLLVQRSVEARVRPGHAFRGITVPQGGDDPFQLVLQRDMAVQEHPELAVLSPLRLELQITKARAYAEVRHSS
jgi:hypothetical protein